MITTTERMGLRAFVADALTEILGGVMDAQNMDAIGKFVGDTDAADPHKSIEGLLMHARGYVTIVRFDLAVTAADKQSGGASGKAAIWVVSAELGGQTERQNETISRLQFAIPVALPDPIGKATKREDER